MGGQLEIVSNWRKTKVNTTCTETVPSHFLSRRFDTNFGLGAVVGECGRTLQWCSCTRSFFAVLVNLRSGSEPADVGHSYTQDLPHVQGGGANGTSQISKYRPQIASNFAVCGALYAAVGTKSRHT